MKNITEVSIRRFEQVLQDEEKSKATIEKYGSALRKLMAWMDGREVSHTLLKEYRDFLKTDHAVSSVNGIISAINSYLETVEMPECKLKLMKVQRKVFRSEEKEMTKEEYFQLVKTAEQQGRTRLPLIMETICSTGIRVSEVQYITVEAATQGYAEVTLKGKTRSILIPGKLSKKLLKYAKKQKIVSGAIFLTRNGTPISRKQIWAEMKSLCEAAGINAAKVYPHNLRHLFARCFYRQTHDVVKLADMLGHSSVETTRIYLISTGVEHAKILDQLKLVS